jgi:hypothetical protein
MDALLASIEALPATAWVRSGVWPFAIVNTLHVIGIALLLGGIAVLDLRIAGNRPRGLPIAALSSLVLPVAAAGLALALATGMLMLLANAREYLQNPYLPWKLAFIAAAVANLSLLHAGPWRRRAQWQVSVPGRVTLAALASLALWTAALVCGRLMAYF